MCAGKRAVSVSCRLLAAVCLPACLPACLAGWLVGWLAGWLAGCNISEMCLGVRPCAAPILNSSRHCPPVTRLPHACFQFLSGISSVFRFRIPSTFFWNSFFFSLGLYFRFSNFPHILLIHHLCNSSNNSLKMQSYCYIFYNVQI